MKTTLNIDDTVMRRLRIEAARHDTTISALVEAGLRRFLDEVAEPAGEALPPLLSWPMGPALVDVSDREAVVVSNGMGPGGCS